MALLLDMTWTSKPSQPKASHHPPGTRPDVGTEAICRRTTSIWCFWLPDLIPTLRSIVNIHMSIQREAAV